MVSILIFYTYTYLSQCKYSILSTEFFLGYPLVYPRKLTLKQRRMVVLDTGPLQRSLGANNQQIHTNSIISPSTIADNITFISFVLIALKGES